jgi:hypothetical protein
MSQNEAELDYALARAEAAQIQRNLDQAKRIGFGQGLITSAASKTIADTNFTEAHIKHMWDEMTKHRSAAHYYELALARLHPKAKKEAIDRVANQIARQEKDSFFYKWRNTKKLFASKPRYRPKYNRRRR